MKAKQEGPTYVSGHNLLVGKTALITAAAGVGIGFATALKMAQEGVSNLVISDIHEQRLQDAVNKIEAETGVLPIPVLCNVTKESEVQNLIDTAVDNMGHIDILVNNAGFGTRYREAQDHRGNWIWATSNWHSESGWSAATGARR